MITRFSASAWSTALIDFSRDTESGTMMKGKITRSFSGSTGRTSGILIASSFAVSFASVIACLSRAAGNQPDSAMAVPVSKRGRISRLIVTRYILQVAPPQSFAHKKQNPAHHDRQRTDHMEQNGSGDGAVDVEPVKRFEQPLADLVEAADAARRGDGQADRGHGVDQERGVVRDVAAEGHEDDPELRGEAGPDRGGAAGDDEEIARALGD